MAGQTKNPSNKGNKMLSKTRTAIISLTAVFSFGGAAIVPTVSQGYVMQEKPSLEPEYQPGGRPASESEVLPSGEASPGLERVETPAPGVDLPAPPLVPVGGLKAEYHPRETLLLALSTKTCVVCE
jgi:hypothetical protein